MRHSLLSATGLTFSLLAAPAFAADYTVSTSQNQALALGTLGFLGNSVEILAGVTINGAGVAVSDSQRGWLLTNGGTIIGSQTGAALTYGASLTNTGAITGGEDGVGTGRFLGAGLGYTGSTLITNSGRITGLTRNAIWSEGGGTITNSASGVITGQVNGIQSGGSLSATGRGSSVTNAGRIEGSTGAGVYLQFGGDVTNTGTITGRYGIVAMNGATVINSGVINATGGNAVLFDYEIGAGNVAAPSVSISGADTLILRTGSVIHGNVDAGSGNDTLVLEGQGLEDAVFSRFEDLIMRGTSWTISGNSTFDRLTIESGELSFSGTVLGATSVGVGQKLMGRGRFGALSNSGTISPGDSIGTITVVGDYTHAAGAVYEVEIASPAQSDLIAAGGRAFLNGGSVVVTPTAGAYGVVNDYTIVTAPGGIVGQFASARSTMPFLTPTLSNDASGVRLRMTLDTGYGSIYPTMRTVAVHGAQQSLRTLGNLFETISAASVRTFATWGYGAYQSVKLDDGQSPAIKANDTSVYVGTTYAATEQLDVGAYGGFNVIQADTTNNLNTGEVQSYLVGVYASVANNGFNASLTYAHAWDDYDVARTMPGVVGQTSFIGRREMAAVRLSYVAQVQALEVMPFAGLAYVQAKQKAFIERDAGLLNASSGDAGLSSARARLGVRVNGNIGESTYLSPYIGGNWSRELKDRDSTQLLTFAGVPGATFAMPGVVAGRNAAEAEAGAIYRADGWSMDVGYVGVFANNVKSHSIRGMIAYSW